MILSKAAQHPWQNYNPCYSRKKSETHRNGRRDDCRNGNKKFINIEEQIIRYLDSCSGSLTRRRSRHRVRCIQVPRDVLLTGGRGGEGENAEGEKEREGGKE